MRVLGIETSCDETAAAVVDDARLVRSSVVFSQASMHAEYGGVVPEIASRAHAERLMPVVRAALDDAGAGFESIDAIAVGHRPGLVGSLLVGVAAAKALAWSLGVPLVAVDHVHAHLYAGLLSDVEDDAGAVGGSEMEWPALGLVVSGGHSSLYRLDGLLEPERLGATIDDAIGEAYDKVGTMLGLPYPAGPEVDRLAQEPGADDRRFEFPVSRLGPTSLDVSFSGLKTSVLYAIRGTPPSPHGKRPPKPATPLTPENTRDLAAGFQRAAVRAVMLKLGRAADRMTADGAAPRSLLAGGGVTANSRLRASLVAFAEERGLALRLPRQAWCVDNAAMIAGLGAALHREGRSAGLDLVPVPTTAC